MSAAAPGSCSSTPSSTSVCVADLDLLPTAVEEMLRWISPIKNMARTVTADIEFHGTQLSKGEKMLLLYESANRDEDVSTTRSTFDIDRASERPRRVRLRHPLLPRQSACPRSRSR